MSELHPPQHDHHCYLPSHLLSKERSSETWHIDMIHSQIYFNCTLILPSGKRISRTLIIPPHIQAQLAEPFAPTNGAQQGFPEF